jgi:hypothetical protein
LTNSYLQIKKQREAYETQKGEIVFGLLGGTVLLMFGILNNWPVNGASKFFTVLSLAIMLTGIFLILSGIVVPVLLKQPYKGFVFIGKKIGEGILISILTVIYLIMVIPVGLFMRKKSKDSGFLAWSGKFPYEERKFEEIKHKNSENIDNTIRSSFLRNIYKIFGTLIRNKRFFLIPAAIILVVLGLILFFAASNIIFNFFIYTLF